MAEGKKDLSRREFLNIFGLAGAGFLLPSWLKGQAKDGKTKSVDAVKKEEEVRVENLERKERFRPLEGPVQWQYVSFDYEESPGKDVGITLSMTSIDDPIEGRRLKNRLLVMKHDFASGNTNQVVLGEGGGWSFDYEENDEEKFSAYTFKQGEKERAKLVYKWEEDCYLLNIDTGVFNTHSIDNEGLKLVPQGDLNTESKGRFTVVDYPGGEIDSNYYSDNLSVEKVSGEKIGAGVRDSQDLIPVFDSVPVFPDDVDHTWVYSGGELEDGRRFFIKSWVGISGDNDFRFVTISEEVEAGSGNFRVVQYNQEDAGFELEIASDTNDEEEVEVAGKKKRYAHGGAVIAKYQGEKLFELDVNSKPDQVIEDDTGILGKMVEAHGIVSGSFGGQNIRKSNIAMWETTDEELFKLFAPLVSH